MSKAKIYEEINFARIEINCIDYERLRRKIYIVSKHLKYANNQILDDLIYFIKTCCSISGDTFKFAKHYVNYLFMID